MLVAAANPCRCGYYGDPHRQCTCTVNQLEQYRQKMSGPFLDRMDLQIYLSAPPVEYRMEGFCEETEHRLSSAEMRKQIQEIREIQAERYKNERILYNSQLTPGLMEKYCVLTPEAKQNFALYLKKFRISIRAQHKILRTSRTIADGVRSDLIQWEHVAEALQYRSGWRREGEQG
jgi:magnesium chelatase family protein